MFELLQFEFIRNALIAGLFASVACGIVGSIIVSRRLVSIAGGVAHSSFGGIGLGIFFKFNPMLGAFLFAIISSLGINYVSRKTKISEDTAIGIMWAFGMSLGLVLVGLSKGYAANLFMYLFGNILAVNYYDIAALIALDIVLILSSVLFYKEIHHSVSNHS